MEVVSASLAVKTRVDWFSRIVFCYFYCEGDFSTLSGQGAWLFNNPLTWLVDDFHVRSESLRVFLHDVSRTSHWGTSSSGFNQVGRGCVAILVFSDMVIHTVSVHTGFMTHEMSHLLHCGGKLLFHKSTCWQGCINKVNWLVHRVRHVRHIAHS